MKLLRPTAKPQQSQARINGRLEPLSSRGLVLQTKQFVEQTSSSSNSNKEKDVGSTSVLGITVFKSNLKLVTKVMLKRWSKQ
jgi:hypothetical protein